jgi:hypothetical protein
MATVLDSLVLEFNLDPSQFTREQQRILDQIRKMQEEVKTRAIDIESSVKRITSTFSNLQRGALGVIGGFFGGEVLKTIDGFARMEAQVGRIATTIGLSAQQTLAWGNAFKALGYDTQAGLSALAQTTSTIEQGALTGNLSAGLFTVSQALGRQGMAPINLLRGGTGPEGHMTAPEAWLAITKRLDELDIQGPRRAALLDKAGLDPSTRMLLMEGAPAIAKLVAEMQRLAPLTKEEADRAQEYVKNVAKLDTAFSHLGMVVTNLATGPLAAFAEFLAQWLGGQSSQGAGISMHDWIVNDWMGFRGSSAIKDAAKRAAGTNAAGDFAAVTQGGYTEATPFPAIRPGEDANTARMIIAAAQRAGIDPNIALKVWSSEGRGAYTGDKGTSFGPFQLHYGGGLGDTFSAMTGLSAADPRTVPQQIEFAMQQAKRLGWGPWHGWHGSPTAGGAGRPGPAPQHTSFNIQQMNVTGDNSKEVASNIGKQVERMKIAYLANSAAV